MESLRHPEGTRATFHCCADPLPTATIACTVAEPGTAAAHTAAAYTAAMEAVEAAAEAEAEARVAVEGAAEARAEAAEAMAEAAEARARAEALQAAEEVEVAMAMEGAMGRSDAAVAAAAVEADVCSHVAAHVHGSRVHAVQRYIPSRSETPFDQQRTCEELPSICEVELEGAHADSSSLRLSLAELDLSDFDQRTLRDSVTGAFRPALSARMRPKGAT
uniref:Uncharacterized protein n=1 Tax=Haptolina brevifila TaxID=156173 RepID=A0A7S2CAT0_9EUKA